MVNRVVPVDLISTKLLPSQKRSHPRLWLCAWLDSVDAAFETTLTEDSKLSGGIFIRSFSRRSKGDEGLHQRKQIGRK